MIFVDDSSLRYVAMRNEYDDYTHDEEAGYQDEIEGLDGATLKHSGLGIASFVLAICTGLLEVVSVVAVVVKSNPGQAFDVMTQLVIGFIMLAGLFIALIGTILGFAGLVQTKRSKVFPALGFALNTVLFVGVLCLACAGAEMPN